MSPEPQAVAKYRDETHAITNWYNLRTNVCTKGKKTRSLGQFLDHPTICRTCRKGK